MKKGYSFCCHHDILFEYCHDFDERQRAIKQTKPAEEHEARLNNFVLIPAKLLRDLPGFAALDKAWAVYNKARAACDKAWAACDKAWAAADAAYAAAYAAARAAAVFAKKNHTALVALHKKLAPKNTWNGKNIGWE